MILRKSILSVVLTIAMLMPLAQAVTVKAADDTKQIDVLFTHDTHSHLDSFSTIVNGEQKEVGGFAKIKTLINEKKKEDPDTLILDGGDFSMGTLIQTVYDTEAAELRMLGYLGYDVTTEYSCAMKSHFRKFGNQMSGSGNHLCNYASLLA